MTSSSPEEDASKSYDQEDDKTVDSESKSKSKSNNKIMIFNTKE
tara:strand:- start:657 stop:788 length:132 start_codon:yes stop_codon:yes gene_type:complete